VTTVPGVVICCCHPGEFRSSSVLRLVADGIIVAMLQLICLYVLGYFFFAQAKCSPSVFAGAPRVREAEAACTGSVCWTRGMRTLLLDLFFSPKSIRILPLHSAQVLGLGFQLERAWDLQHLCFSMGCSVLRCGASGCSFTCRSAIAAAACQFGI
jgi:hypothetical protein